ncbi:S-adenosyl-L-methionine-dependent methyltransferase [Podospora conica]|nr:S-adenosyl-L-methionine-dependent methyltransferase [Schizothecium conicum]
MAHQNGDSPTMPLTDLDMMSDCLSDKSGGNMLDGSKSQRLSVASHGSTSSYPNEDDSSDNRTDADTSSANSLHGSFSLPPSVSHASYRHGRRYQTYRDERYVLPNDEGEQAREALTHHMMLEALDGRHILAPLPEDVKMIMDLGTGTGMWAMDVAEMYPDAEVHGVDLSPIQPSDVPPNVKFFIDDIEDYCVGDAVYNYIHARFLCSFIQDPAAVIRRTFSKLKPRGWVELQELDHTIHCDDSSVKDDYPVQQYCKITSKVTKELRGIDVQVAPKLGKMMEDAGYTDIRSVKYKVPIGEWVKDHGKDKKYRSLGEVMKYIVDWAVPPMCALNAQGMGWSEEETQEFVQKCHDALYDSSYHSYMYVYVWMGYKPEDA